MEKAFNLYITCILFDNHSPFQKSVFGHSKYILGDVLDKYIQKYEKYFLQKIVLFALECIYSFLLFQFCYFVSSL